MDDPEEILSKEFDLLRQDLIARHIELGQPASGQWENTLESQVSRLNAKIVGQDYTEQLVNGRAPGRFPPIAAIEQWIQDKGITPIEESLSISSLAFLIARAIAERGTKIFQEGGTDLVDSVITPERIQGIINRVSEFYISEFVLNVTNQLEEIAQS